MTCLQRSNASSTRYVPLLGIGRGGMGRIDVALAVGVPGAEQLVVLKRLLEPQQHNEEERASLMREASLSSRLTHPSIVATHGLDMLDGELVLVLEYLEGASLAALTRSCAAFNEPFPRPILLRVLRDVLAGLGHAHDLRDYDGTPLSIVHRDVSPANVLVTVDGASKVLDFGIAKASRSHVDTPPGFIKGKLGYMAPEQILGFPTDRRADIYAVGVMLWETLTGRRFSASESIQTCLSLRLREEAPAVRDIAPAVPRALEHIVQRCLAGAPEGRWPTAGALRAALDEYVTTHGEDASPHDVAAFVRRHYGGLLDSRRRTLRERIGRTVGRTVSGTFARPAATSAPPLAIDCLPPSKGAHAHKDAPTRSALHVRPRASKLWPFVAGLVGAIGSWCFSSLPSAQAGATVERTPRALDIESARHAESRPYGKAPSHETAVTERSPWR